MTYRQTHDHLGNPRSEPQRDIFRVSDLVIFSIAFAVITAIFSGVLL